MNLSRLQWHAIISIVFFFLWGFNKQDREKERSDSIFMWCIAMSQNYENANMLIESSNLNEGV